MVKKMVGLAVLGLSLALTTATQASPAPDVEDCQQLIADLLLDLDGVAIGGRNRASLESKLTGASRKLDELKFFDALEKVTDFRDKVLDLGYDRKPKMDPADADFLAAGAQEVIDCILELIG